MFRSLERTEAHDTRAPDNHVEVYQELVDAFDNPRFPPELECNRCTDRPTEIDYQTTTFPGGFQPDPEYHLQHVSPEQITAGRCRPEWHCTAASEDCEDGAAIEGVRVADSVRYGAFRKGWASRVVAQQGSGVLHFVTLRSVLAGHCSGCDIHLVSRIPLYPSLTHCCRLQEETAKVEEHLMDNHYDKPSFTDAIVKCLTYSKANAFENILEPLQKLLRLSPPIASTLARPDLFTKIGQKLHHNKAAVRLNLLRIISSICDSSEEQGGLLAGYGLLDAIQDLENDPAILVRDMAGKLIRSSERSEAYGLKRKQAMRRPSTSTTPPGFLANQSAPSTPQINRSSQSKGYYDGRESPRQPRNSLNGSSLALRPGSRDGNSPAVNGGSIASRSRLPRGSRFHHADLLPEEDDPSEPAQLTRRPSILPRRRRRTLVDAEWT